MPRPKCSPARIAEVIKQSSIVAAICLAITSVSPASGFTPLPEPDPVPGSYGLEATKTQPPPTQGATITTPSNGASFSTSPITVSGICPNNLLVQIYNNGVMVGSVMCEGSSFRVEVSLFAGDNELTAIVYDSTNQPGPVSNTVRVTYTDTSFSAFGELITLTSSYGRRSAPMGQQLVWPLQLSGGTGPYAFSIDWGDGGDPQLMSQSLSGVIGIDHEYKRAGIYRVNVRVTDTNGVSAFLQLIAVSNGRAEGVSGGKIADTQPPQTVVMWIPAAISLGLLFPAFWLGRKSQLVSLRNKMLKERDAYQKK